MKCKLCNKKIPKKIEHYNRKYCLKCADKSKKQQKNTYNKKYVKTSHFKKYISTRQKAIKILIKRHYKEFKKVFEEENDCHKIMNKELNISLIARRGG